MDGRMSPSSFSLRTTVGGAPTTHSFRLWEGGGGATAATPNLPSFPWWPPLHAWHGTRRDSPKRRVQDFQNIRIDI